MGKTPAKAAAYAAFIYLFWSAALIAQPVIDVWYGNNQKFGNFGRFQNQINILGKATYPGNSVQSVSYSLNGGSYKALNIGPYPAGAVRRVYNPGDFNIEIFTETEGVYTRTPGLIDGDNSVTIKAVGGDLSETTEVVNFKYIKGITCPLPFTVRFDTVTNIQNVAQITDGYWEITPDGIRTKTNEWGYDRVVGVGDINWENYEATVRFKIFGAYTNFAAPSFGNALLLMARWTGHTDQPQSTGGQDPKAGYWPYGLLADFVDSSNPNKIELYAFGDQRVAFQETNDYTIDYGDMYVFKVSIQSQPTAGPLLKMKYWKEGSAEPNWLLTGTHPTGNKNPAKGSFLMISHHFDAAFYSVDVAQIDPLPVELTAFSGKTEGESVILSWQTATEINNYGFDIERMLKGESHSDPDLSGEESKWERIGFVEGAGNSNSPKYYSFIDNKPAASTQLSYRLKQIDNDGKYSYSKEITVEISAIPTEFSLSQNYPNPFNPTTTIKYSIPVTLSPVTVSLVVYNLLGQEVATLVNQKQPAGNYEVKFDASSATGGLASGVYLYKIEAGGFTAVKKLMLLK